MHSLVHCIYTPIDDIISVSPNDHLSLSLDSPKSSKREKDVFKIQQEREKEVFKIQQEKVGAVTNGKLCLKLLLCGERKDGAR